MFVRDPNPSKQLFPPVKLNTDIARCMAIPSQFQKGHRVVTHPHIHSVFQPTSRESCSPTLLHPHLLRVIRPRHDTLAGIVFIAAAMVRMPVGIDYQDRLVSCYLLHRFMQPFRRFIHLGVDHDNQAVGSEYSRIASAAQDQRQSGIVLDNLGLFHFLHEGAQVNQVKGAGGNEYKCGWHSKPLKYLLHPFHSNAFFCFCKNCVFQFKVWIRSFGTTDSGPRVRKRTDISVTPHKLPRKQTRNASLKKWNEFGMPKPNRLSMIKNYLIVAWRNLVRNRVFSIINIVGLAIGLSICTLIYQYIQFELSYDRFNSIADRLYRVTLANTDADASRHASATNHPDVAPAMQVDFPEV